MLAFSPFDIFLPVRYGLTDVLVALAHAFEHVPVLSSLGPFGLAIIVVTLALRTILFPLFSWQIRTTRRVWAEQQLLKPELNKLRKKHRGDRVALNQEMQKLYAEHGMNPMAQMAGCLPLLVQIPILSGLYTGIRDAAGPGKLLPAHASSCGSACSFLGLRDMSQSVSQLGGWGADHGAVLILPILAALTTYVSSKVMMLPVPPNASAQEAQMASVNRTTTLIMPAMIFFFAIGVPQGIALYWVTQSLYMIFQEWALIGFGELKVPSWFPGSSRKGPLDIDNVMMAVRKARPSLDRLHLDSHGASTEPVKTGKATRNASSPPQQGQQRNRGNGTVRGSTGPPSRTGPPARGGQRRRGR